ncbi:MAG: glutathione S-transferase [Oceanicoccus sp.]|jgi:glutathione S-transferase
MKLYDLPHSPFAARVRLLSYAKGIALDILPPPGFKTPAYLMINPIGKVPVLDVDGVIITESQVIMNYLEQRFPETPLLPDNLEQRAVTQSYAAMIDAYLTPPLFAMFGQVFHRSADDAAMAALFAEMTSKLGLMEQLIIHFDRQQHRQLDFADCAMVPVMFFVLAVCHNLDQPDPLADCPQLSAWWQWANDNQHCSRVNTELDEGLTGFLARINA